jgi:hypothetical protein
MRLITFGDSLTYGHHLSNPKDSWPCVLGKLLGFKTLNNGVPGHSNLEILTDILNFKFLETDTVIVGWTYVYRDVIHSKSFFRNIKKISVWNNDEISKSWQKLHNGDDLAIRSGLYIHHAQCYLNTLNIKNYHFFIPEKFNKKPIFINTLDNWYKNIRLKTIDLANDKMHPGPKTYSNLANLIYKEIKIE